MGVVSGLGSVIVNGIRFDDGTARVVDDDGTPRSTADIRLGMTVAIASGPVTPPSGDAPGQATATRITYGSSVAGRVTARNLVSTPPTLTVAGQTVLVPAGTVIVGSTTGVNGISTSDLIEVHALADPATQRYFATRIERRTDLSECKVVGTALGVDTALKAFVLGGLTVDYTGASVAGLTEGARVQVKLALNSADNSCTNLATRVTALSPTTTEGARTTLEGHISDYTSNASFKINGIPVQASSTVGGLGNGVRVLAEGLVQSGVLVATQIAVRNPLASRDVRLFGTGSTVDPLNQTVTLRGVTVLYATALFENGASLSSLDDGSRLDVQGQFESNGQRLIATRVRREN